MSGLTRRAADGVESGGWIMHAFSFGKIGAASVRPDSIVDSMNPRHLRAAVESFYADVWNRQDTSRIPRLLDPHFTFRGSLGETRTGHDGFASYLDFVHGAVSGFTCDILEVVVEPPKVFARVRFSGNHRGPLLGFPPTRKRVEWLGAALFTFSGEQIADLWVLGDVDGLTKLLERNADD